MNVCHLNLSDLMFKEENSTSNPVFCTVAGKLDCIVLKPVIEGNGYPTS